MTDGTSPTNPILGVLSFVGRRFIAVLDQIGTAMWLMFEAVGWVVRSITQKKVRIGRRAIVSQIVRVGVRSVFIVGLVSGCVGFILALQMSPPLDDFGQKDKVANITGVAVLRELGPLIAAIVLTGFAGAAIAAEIGTMVVGEEIEALEAHALNPVRFLVVPRVIATVVSMTCLAVFSDWIAISAGYLVGVYALGIEGDVYYRNTLDQVKLVDFLTGIGKATVFGLLIGLISCMNGLRVTGGAAGVGNATTGTVVQSIVAIIIADLIFTGIFYSVGWV
ncbi:MAG: MlaE family ABC transporter permease [Phycisphaerales bacterium]